MSFLLLYFCRPGAPYIFGAVLMIGSGAIAFTLDRRHEVGLIEEPAYQGRVHILSRSWP